MTIGIANAPAVWHSVLQHGHGFPRVSFDHCSDQCAAHLQSAIQEINRLRNELAVADDPAPGIAPPPHRTDHVVLGPKLADLPPIEPDPPVAATAPEINYSIITNLGTLIDLLA